MKRNPDPRGRRSGFSLVEVALALMVAASGLVAVFSLFPASLKQNTQTRADMSGSLFAATLLETIAGNVRQIDDVKVWNDPEKWWNVAISGAGLDGTKVAASSFASASHSGSGHGSFSPMTVDVAADYQSSADGAVFYYGRELTKAPTTAPAATSIAAPPQYLVRVATVKRRAIGVNGNQMNGTSIPNRYVVSVVSSPNASPEIYTTAQTFSQEYSFVHRP